MKKYKIVVNGVAYEVEAEEIPAGAAYTAPANIQASLSTTAPVNTSAPVPAVPESAPVPTAPAPSAGTQTVECPMPGTVLDIRVKPGETVTQGQVLLILEAMKMENEIIAPAPGIIDVVQTTKGAAVNAGDTLITLKSLR